MGLVYGYAETQNADISCRLAKVRTLLSDVALTFGNWT